MSAASAPRLPVFVYGTLRVGGLYHDDTLAGRFVATGPAALDGAHMWDQQGHYPMIVLDADAGLVTSLRGCT